MDQILSLHELFVEGGNPEKSHVLLHITEPSTPEEKEKGYFFAICEANNASTDQIVKLQNIIDTIETEYYEVDEQDEANSLEKILEKSNHQGYSLLHSDIELNCVVGAICHNDITFSYFGTPLMVLFYKNKLNEYKKLDLIELNKNQEETNESPQLFSQIVQGKVSANDYLFVGTPKIINFFDLDRLEKIITTRPARQSAQHLERVLSELKNGSSFGGLIVNLQERNEEMMIKRSKPTIEHDSKQSLNKLFATEQKTTNILSSSFFPQIENRMKSMFKSEEKNSTDNTNTTRIPYPKQQTEVSSAHLRTHRPSATKRNDSKNFLVFLNGIKTIILLISKLLISLVLLCWQIIIGLLRMIGLLVLLITNYQNRRRAVIEEWRAALKNFLQNIERLPMITKILAVVSLLIIIIFVGSISYLRHEQRQKQANELYLSQIKEARTKKESAESAIIYHDEIGALAELQLAQQIIQQIKCTDKTEQADCFDLIDQLNNLAVKIRKEVPVQPQLITEFGKDNCGLNHLVRINGKLIAYGSNTTTLPIYDTLTRQSKVLSTLISGNGITTAATPKENDYTIFLTNEKKLLRFDPKDDSLKTVEFEYANPNADIKNLVIYNRRIYAMDTANSQIYKHDNIKNGFGRGQNWLKAPADIKTGVAMAVDGDLFVLKENGEILKFNTGDSLPFSLQGVEPSLKSGTAIWTYTDLVYLYILDNQNKRLLIINKDGRLEKQITFGDLSPTDMIIDEQSSIGYLIADCQLYQINLK